MAFDVARAKSLFLGASDVSSPEGRAAYLDRECGGEPELRARVEALLGDRDRAGPAPDLEATGLFDLDQAGLQGATRTSVSEARRGSSVSGPDDGPSTVEDRTGLRSRVETPVEGPGVPPAARSFGFAPGRVIAGRYTLLEVLGEGGMGTVYRAEQSRPVKRQVALKLIKVGMDSRTVLARFDAERQALAMMDHPNIARVYDGGATEVHQPFFVMEFVQGVPIADYCDQHRLSVKARLRLFVAACRAVQHAHQKGIIHRDLKPSNVMVTEVDGRPTPKVIDFGVAKATESSLTEQTLGDTGAIVGTPAYMSPEQADPSSMDIDTRTDVYALGVILYELLAGSTPLDPARFKRGALLEMLRMVREVDPAKPSTKVGTADALPSIAACRGVDPERLERELRGDLDWIVMKALEKDRTRRYETANDFAADILRHLASEPVQAAPPGRSYRLRKFVQKHRAGVIAASLVVSALLAGIAGTTLGWFEAKRQEGLARSAERLTREERDRALKAEARAHTEADKTTAINQFLTTDLLTQAEPAKNAAEDHVTLLEVLDRAADKVGKRFGSQPEVEVALRRSIANTYHGLASWDKAEQQHRAMLGLARRPGAKPGEYYQAEAGLAHILRHQGRVDDQTLALARSATEGLKLTSGVDHPETLASMTNLAHIYGALGRHDEALKLNEETLALNKTKFGPDHLNTLVSLSNLAGSYYALGRYDEALKLNEETVARQKAKLGPGHPVTLMGMHNLANSYYVLGRFSDALKCGEETVALKKAKLGPDHPDTLLSMNNLALSYEALGRHTDALKLREETVALMKAKLGPDHPDTLRSMNDLAGSYSTVARDGEALPLLEKSSLANPKDSNLALDLAVLQAWCGKVEDFAASRRRFLASAKGTNDLRLAERVAKLSSLLPSSEPAELEAALALGREAVRLGEGQDQGQAWNLLAMGMAAYRAGDDAACEQALIAVEDVGKDNPRAMGIAAFYRAMCLFRRGKPDEARKLATEAAAKMNPPPADERNLSIRHADRDDLIRWLAYKEAKALIGFDAPPTAPARPNVDGIGSPGGSKGR